MTTAITFKTDPATRRTMKCMLIAFGLLLNAPALAAADSELSQTYSAWMDKSKGVTSEMLDCISAEFTRQDDRLNENYKRLMSKLSGKRKEGLLEAQRAWISLGTQTVTFIMTRMAAPPRIWPAAIVC